MVEESCALGLDLGTTFSCIGVYRNGEVEIIPNRNGDRVTPSIVTIIDKDHILKGEEALEHLVKNYDSSIYAIKRFIGRDYNSKEVQDDINKSNFPFKIVGDPKTKNPIVEVTKNNQIMKFTLEEISSFVIRKLADSAQKFLNRKVDKLVITVPANFNNAQRNCTRQAASIANIEVLRIINEPTAAALAYGLQDKESTKNGKILVFDLGGGTFDVTILSINKQKEENFEIISTNGNKFLGGEDFDNKLVDYFLENFCRKIKVNMSVIKENKRIIKNLKISCENVKKVLSTNTSTTLNIPNFYNNQDLMETIRRDEFEELCSDLFKELEIPINAALKDASITPEEIKEIVLVGGSTRIPKIKTFLTEKFGKECKINDTINPDEAVAYGATLMAAKILIKGDKVLQGFNLMDITPLSLGVAVGDKNSKGDTKQEDLLMSVIIKRASKIPYNNSEIYRTSHDNQKVARIRIYEGEKKYVKYNHVLGELYLKNLPPKPKGKVKIKVKFFIDVNGILNVTAAELSDKGEELRPVEVQIEYQSIGLNNEKIKELKNKNKKYYDNIRTPNIKFDFSGVRENLLECEEAIKETTDEEEKYNILMGYITVFEEFINSFDQDNYDNETMLEKYYLFLKKLFETYVQLLNIKKPFESIEENKQNITNNIKNYIKIFTLRSSGYLYDLLDTLKGCPKMTFYEIVIFAMEQKNINGKKCLEERKEFCRYNSLIFFESAYTLFNKYIIDLNKIVICPQGVKEKCKEQLKLCLIYINEVKTGSILLLEDSIRQGQLIKSNNTGFTSSLYGFKFTNKEETEKNEIILQNYEKMLREMNPQIEISPRKTIFSKELALKEAICIANIVKISNSFLGKTNERLIKLCERCEYLAKEELKIDEKVEWYKEFCDLYKEIKSIFDVMELNKANMRKTIKEKYKQHFTELERKFNKCNKKNPKEFIDFILQKYPYKDYEEDLKDNKIDTSKIDQKLLDYLRGKYHPDQYEYSSEDENSQLLFCIVEVIEANFNNLYENIQ